MNARKLITIAIAGLLIIGGATALGAASPADQANQSATDAFEMNHSAADQHSPPDVANINHSAAVNQSSVNATDVNQSVAGNVSEVRDKAANASNAAVGAVDGVGPADGLPVQVPDHVHEIHDTVESFLNESIDRLGSALGDLLGNGDS